MNIHIPLALIVVIAVGVIAAAGFAVGVLWVGNKLVRAFFPGLLK